MANNPYVNKVVYDGVTLINLMDDVVTTSDVRLNVSFHLPNGAPATGSAPTATATVSGTTLYLTDGFPVEVS